MNEPSRPQMAATPRRAYQPPEPDPRAPRVVLVGRPNVGKSTLFNRLLRRRLALVFDRAGVTRDRLDAGCLIQSARGDERHAIWLSDTAGLVAPTREDDVLREASQAQALAMVHLCDLALLVVDAKAGRTALDEEAAMVLRKAGRPFAVVVNKVDPGAAPGLTADFYALGGKDVLSVSAEHALHIDALQHWLAQTLLSRGLLTDVTRYHGRDGARAKRPARRPHASGVADAVEPDDADGPAGDDASRLVGAAANMDVAADTPASEGFDVDPGNGDESLAASEGAVLDNLEADGPSVDAAASQVEWQGGPIAVAIVGRPNAGKSSLINALLATERLVASPIAGTTRDAIDTPWHCGDQPFVLIDTAGIRRRSHIADRLEALSVSAAIGSIDRADVVVLLLNATERPSEQDSRIAALAIERGKGLVLVASQWDRVENPEWRDNFAPALRHDLPFADFAPIVKTSATARTGLSKLAAAIVAVQRERHRRVGTGALNRFFQQAVASRPPPVRSGRTASLAYVSQPMTCPPTFVVSARRTGGLPESYRRYLINQLRKRYGFVGTPIWLKLRATKDRHAEAQ